VSLPECASVGRVRRPHGVRGELVVEALTDEPDAIFAPGSRVFQGTHEGTVWLDPQTREPRALTVTARRPFKEGWLITFDAITDRTEAEKWNGRYLLVPVDELSDPEDGEVFAHELVGMQLVDAERGTPIGEVVEFYELPQGLLLEFRTASGVASLPFVDEFVQEVDREARIISVRLPEGLLES
jgi:16S rRNA processing protein RimM